MADHGYPLLKAVHDPFFAMPDELLLHIFSYLTPDDLLNNVPLVSRRWSSLSRDKTLSIRLRIDLGKMDVKEALGLIRMTTKLRSLTLVSSMSWAWCDDILDSVSKLDTLILCGVKVKKTDTLSGLIQRCGHLKYISIRKCWFPRKVPHLLDILARCSHLESIYLNTRSPKLLDLTLKRRWTRLQRVTIEPRNRPADEEFDLLASTRSLQRHLRHISICLQRPESFISLDSFQQLESLDLPHCKITDGDLREGLSQLTYLRHLSLQGPCSLTSPAIQAFFHSLSDKPYWIITKLETLKLDGIVTLDDSCLEVISRCESLIDVEVINCDRITPFGLAVLHEKVRSNRGMEQQEYYERAIKLARLRDILYVALPHVNRRRQNKFH